jgi:hypothetical protein
MKWVKPTGLALASLVLLGGTALVFLAFDRTSHSASDTLRPFIITMAPVWTIAIAAAAVLLRPRILNFIRRVPAHQAEN